MYSLAPIVARSSEEFRVRVCDRPFALEEDATYARQAVAPEGPQAAVRVADGCPVDDVHEAREEWVADAREPRHRAGLDALQPVAHHELRALVEFVDVSEGSPRKTRLNPRR